MRAWWIRAGAAALSLAAATPGPSARADDDVPAAAAPAARRRGRRSAGIDLAAHVDINVVLPPNTWRVNGGLQNVFIGGGGRLVIDGNLTIGGEPIAAEPERVQRTDAALVAQLRQSQRDRLAAVAADRSIPPDRRRALELATEVDIRRVMTAVAVLRQRYAGERAELGDENWQRFQRDMQLCRRELADPFGDDSLFAAVRAGFEQGP